MAWQAPTPTVKLGKGGVARGQPSFSKPQFPQQKVSGTEGEGGGEACDVSAGTRSRRSTFDPAPCPPTHGKQQTRHPHGRPRWRFRAPGLGLARPLAAVGVRE